MYITKQGQCWDEIAKEVYGKEEYADILMESNMPVLSYFVFPAGVKLNTPDIPSEKENIPEWRKR